MLRGPLRFTKAYALSMNGKNMSKIMAFITPYGHLLRMSIHNILVASYIIK